MKLDYLFNVLLRSSKFLTILISAVIFKKHSSGITWKDIIWGGILTIGVFVFSLG